MVTKMKRFLGVLLALALVLGLMPGMSMTAYAVDAIPADGTAADSGYYFTGFTLDGSETGHNYHHIDGCDADKLFDRTNTRLNIYTSIMPPAASPFTAENPYWIEFHYSGHIVPKKLYIRTGVQVGAFSHRKPKAWVLKAKVNNEDSWNVISRETNADLSNNDYTAKAFDVNATQGYKYFRIEIQEVVGAPSFGNWDYTSGSGYCLDFSEL